MRNRWMLFGVGAVVALGALWFFFFGSDNPEEVSLEDAVAAVTDTTEPSSDSQPENAETGDTGSDDETPAGSDDDTQAGLDGTWTVLADENSFAGYRVGEELASIGITEAVGRTSSVTGTLELEGSTVTAVTIEVDMTTLRSDDDRRDGAMRRQALETNAFPTASFTLTDPIELGAIPEPGVPISITATGDLTLHGVKRPVDVALEAQLVDDKLVAVGNVDIIYGDFDIDLPEAPILVSVEETGLLELQLTFARG